MALAIPRIPSELSIAGQAILLTFICKLKHCFNCKNIGLAKGLTREEVLSLFIFYLN